MLKSKLGALLILSQLTFTAQVFAQKMPPLPPGPPEENIDHDMVQKHSEALMKACRRKTQADLKAQGVATSKVEARARDICFCIAKDIKRREDVNEIEFITQFIQDKFADDEDFNDEQSIHLHEFDKLEKNCKKNPKYRFGMPEPRLPSDAAIESSLNPSASLKKGDGHAQKKNQPTRRK